MHPLAGPREKPKRAAVHLEELKRQFNDFIQDFKHEIVVAELEPCGEYRALRAGVSKQPPLEWGVIIGDIAHNLR